ncbi:MAG: hypothetical protein AB1349_05270 [Elusimicrobiota bacterium]
MNKRQREFIVNICEKIIVYVLTIAIIGQALEKGVSVRGFIILFILSTILFIIGLIVSSEIKEER